MTQRPGEAENATFRAAGRREEIPVAHDAAGGRTEGAPPRKTGATVTRGRGRQCALTGGPE